MSSIASTKQSHIAAASVGKGSSHNGDTANKSMVLLPNNKPNGETTDKDLNNPPIGAEEADNLGIIIPSDQNNNTALMRGENRLVKKP